MRSQMNMDVQGTIDTLTARFLMLHGYKENLYWDVYMGMSSDRPSLVEADMEIKHFLSSPVNRKAIEHCLAAEDLSGIQERELRAWQRFFGANSMFSGPVVEPLLAAESKLKAVAEDGAGYTDPSTGQFVVANSKVMRDIVDMDSDAGRRRAAWEGLRGISSSVLKNGIAEIYVMRNKLARDAGYSNYYEMKLAQMGEMSAKELFALLDDVEGCTREAAEAAVVHMSRMNDTAVVNPWDFNYFKKGSLVVDEDPYFDFSLAVGRWLSTYGGLGIEYAGAFVTVDLVVRDGKHPNGFMHSPSPAWHGRDQWNPAHINFTSTGIPDKAGSGLTALETLMHEGGHAAHFSGMIVPTPAMSTEFPPISVGFVETQSMFLDRLVSDPDWRMRYALDLDGNRMPFELVERGIRMKQPYSVFEVRWLIAVAMAEYEIYKLPDEAITADRIDSICKEMEVRLLGVESPRPILSIVHVRDNESSAGYHGYAIAELGLRQTRACFLERDGHLVDNPAIGPDLALHYWRSGNELPPDECIKALTGSPLSASAFVDSVSMSPDEAVERARDSVARLEDIVVPGHPMNSLNLNLRVVHGAREIVPVGMSPYDAANTFRTWIQKEWPRNSS